MFSMIFTLEGMFEKIVNATFIFLISKKSMAVNIKDFRPISIVDGVYKIIVKVIANKLNLVVEKIISKPPNVFIRDRQILDSFLIVNKCFDNRIRFGESGVLWKLDIEKAYNHVHWDFFTVYAEEMQFWGEIL